MDFTLNINESRSQTKRHTLLADAHTRPGPKGVLQALVLCLALLLSVSAYGALSHLSLQPNQGPCAGGTYLEFSGIGFDDTGTTTVTFDGVPATNVLVSLGYGDVLGLTCNSPAHDLGTVSIVVTNPDGTHATIYSAYTYAASVQSVDVVDGHHVDVTFDAAMGESALVAANYAIDGSGRGNLAYNPNSVSLLSGHTYRLEWTCGDMDDGGDITISVTNVLDSNGDFMCVGVPPINYTRATDVGGGVSIPPTVLSVSVQSALVVDVVFSETMRSDALGASVYTLSGTGKGSLSDHPDSVAKLDETTYRLTWLTGEMVNAGEVTITVANAHDLAGNAVGTPGSATDADGGIGVAPWVSDVKVESGSDVLVTFSEGMGEDASDPENYMLAGTGAGTLAANPNTVTHVSAAEYRLTWSTGEMKNGGDITVQALAVHDAAGNPLTSPYNDTDAGAAIGVSPTVVSAEVASGSSINVTFSEPMDITAKLSDNYTLSGPGQGTLVANPTSAVLASGSTYTLTWAEGDMVDGEDVTVTVVGVSDPAGNPLGTPDSATDVGGGVFVIPAVSSIEPVATPINSPVRFSVAFNKAVRNFDDISDVVIFETGGVAHTGATFSGGPVTFEVAVTGVSGDGTMTLGVSTDSDIQDSSGTALASSLVSSPADVDNTAPEVLDIAATTASPTKEDTVSFTVGFSEPVFNFDGADAVEITETDTLVHTGVTISGGPEEFTVDVTGVSGDGTMTLSVKTGADVRDEAQNSVASSMDSPEVVVDNTAPQATAITTVETSPTNADSIEFSVSFGEDVQGFGEEADVEIVHGENLAYSDAVITGGPRDYVVTLNGVDGDGDLTVSVNTASDVADMSGNALSSSVTSDAVTVDQTAPVASFTLLDASPTAKDTVSFKLSFTEPVGSTFDGDKLSVPTGSLEGSFLVSGSGVEYGIVLTLDDSDEDGVVAIALGDGITDAAGNPCAAIVSESCSIFNWKGFTTDLVDVNLYEGGSHTFTVQANCMSPALEYQWKWQDASKTVHDIGVNSPSYTVTNVSPALVGEYWCVVSYDGSDHASAHAVLDVQEHLEIAVPPRNGLTALTWKHTFDVVASGGYQPYEYEWKRNGETIPGASDSSYTIASAEYDDAGLYSVEVSDMNGDIVASNPVVLTVAQGMPVTTVTGASLLIALLALSGLSLSRKE